MNNIINCLEKSNIELIKGDYDSIFLKIKNEEDFFNENRKIYHLHIAIANKGIDSIFKLLQEWYDVNEYLPNTGTPLHLAIRLLRRDCIVPLLVYGADTNYIYWTGNKNWHILDDFYWNMQPDIDFLYRLFEYGSNPYLSEQKSQSFLLPHFWKFIKSRTIELVIALPHLSAPELIAILEGMYPAADNIPLHKKWALVTTKHLKN